MKSEHKASEYNNKFPYIRFPGDFHGEDQTGLKSNFLSISLH